MKRRASTGPVPRYMVLTAQAGTGRRRDADEYMRVAVVETDGKTRPSRIDIRLRCLVRIVKAWELRSRYTLAQGSKFSQYAEACREADELVRQLNDPLTEFAMRTNPPPGLNLGLPPRALLPDGSVTEWDERLRVVDAVEI